MKGKRRKQFVSRERGVGYNGSLPHGPGDEQVEEGWQIVVKFLSRENHNSDRDLYSLEFSITSTFLFAT